MSMTDNRNAVRAITGVNSSLACESLNAMSGSPRRKARMLSGCTPFLFRNIAAMDAMAKKTTMA